MAIVKYFRVKMRLAFLGSYASYAYRPQSQRQILIVGQSVCHFEDENTRDSLACRLGTSN